MTFFLLYVFNFYLSLAMRRSFFLPFAFGRARLKTQLNIAMYIKQADGGSGAPRFIFDGFGCWLEMKIKWNIRQVEKRDLIIMTSKAQKRDRSERAREKEDEERLRALEVFQFLSIFLSRSSSSEDFGFSKLFSLRFCATSDLRRSIGA